MKKYFMLILLVAIVMLCGCSANEIVDDESTTNASTSVTQQNESTSEIATTETETTISTTTTQTTTKTVTTKKATEPTTKSNTTTSHKPVVPDTETTSRKVDLSDETEDDLGDFELQRVPLS